MISEATFVRSAASAEDLPSDGLAEIALVGRSNVGKSSLINALVGQRIARTSAAPGKTRLANLYRITRGRGRPLYLVDLPGYGYARGGRESAEAFEKLTHEFFAVRGVHLQPDPAALLLVDARHPGLSADVDAWRWLRQAVERSAIVATKIDKLARGERIRALREFESVFDGPVLPVSAVTGEGMDDLWKLIEHLRPSSSNPAPDSRPNSRNSREETGRPRRPLRRPKNSSSRR